MSKNESETKGEPPGRDNCGMLCLDGVRVPKRPDRIATPGAAAVD